MGKRFKIMLMKSENAARNDIVKRLLKAYKMNLSEKQRGRITGLVGGGMLEMLVVTTIQLLIGTSTTCIDGWEA